MPHTLWPYAVGLVVFVLLGLMIFFLGPALAMIAGYWKSHIKKQVRSIRSSFKEGAEKGNNEE